MSQPYNQGPLPDRFPNVQMADVKREPRDAMWRHHAYMTLGELRQIVFWLACLGQGESGNGLVGIASPGTNSKFTYKLPLHIHHRL